MNNEISTAVCFFAFSILLIFRPDWCFKNKELPVNRAQRNRKICKIGGAVFALLAVADLLIYFFSPN
jgi:hypothetical protein